LSDGRTLLVLGARGFLGAHLCTAAEEAGFRVVRASREGAEGAVAADLLDPASLRDAIDRTAPDAVANAAGFASVAASWEDPERSRAINARGAENLLGAVAAAAPGAHVLCLSSAQVYGEPLPERMPFREDQELDPVSPYGRAKAEMEGACAAFAARHGLRIAVARPFNLVGPGQSPDHAVSGFARQAALAEVEDRAAVELDVGNMDAARDFVDVRDAAAALAEVARRGLTGIHTLCSGRAVELREVIAMIGDLTGRPVRVRSVPELAWPADPQVSYGMPDRLHRAIGWSPLTPLRESVGDLIDWWRLGGALR